MRAAIAERAGAEQFGLGPQRRGRCGIGGVVVNDGGERHQAIQHRIHLAFERPPVSLHSQTLRAEIAVAPGVAIADAGTRLRPLGYGGQARWRPFGNIIVPQKS